MSYIALARKWRPRLFSEVVGQEHISKALIHSLTKQRVHHAYLFSGTRGVGKTTIARLLAKSLNCEKGLSAEPCLQCDTCLAIENGQFLDLIEIDGASKTRVEDTRDMLDNVQYAPGNGRFKIYLIDEVHMLSQHSFNALLKTLEEPPSYVKFLLATTDPQKLPVTVLSRCLQFHLKPLTTEVIQRQLEAILTKEAYSFEPTALELLAQAGAGSMRDALSLLEQALAYSEDSLSLQDVHIILGYTQHDFALQLLKALVDAKPQQLMVISQRIATEGGSFSYVLEQLLCYLHQICLVHCLAPSAPPLVSPKPAVIDLSRSLSLEDAQLFYQIGLKGLEALDLAPTAAIGFEMTLLRMYAFQPVNFQKPQAIKPQGNIEPPLPEGNCAMRSESLGALENKAPLSSALMPGEDTAEEMASTAEPVKEDWLTIVENLPLNGLALSALEQAEWVTRTSGRVVLRIGSGHHSLFTKVVVERIEVCLSEYFKEKIKLTLEVDDGVGVTSSPAQQKQTMRAKQQESAEAALQAEPFFQQLKETFAGEVIKGSIEVLTK